MKAAITERQKGDSDGERNLLQEGLKKFPKAEKMWTMLAQLEERYSDLIFQLSKKKGAVVVTGDCSKQGAG